VVLVLATIMAFHAIDPSFFWKDDFQLQYLPGSREVARAWSEGSFPLLSPYSWFCTGLGAEYQYGIFSVARTTADIVVWALPLSLNGRATALLLFHFAILAAGAYLLARSYSISFPIALMVALIASINGWNLWWGTTWYPSVASFAWIPWYWIALRSAVAGRSRWSWLGIALSLYLIIAAGWPFTVLMAAVITVLNLVSLQSRPRTIIPIVGGIAIGGCLASPAVLMLIEYFRSSARMSASGILDFLWSVPITAFGGFVLPTIQSVWAVFVGDMPHTAVELTGGLIPLCAIVAAIGSVRREFWRAMRYELVLLTTLILLLPLHGPNLFRWSFRWLPLVHLTLAIVGAQAFEIVRRARGKEPRTLTDRRNVATWAAGLVVIAFATAIPFDHDLDTTATLAGALFILCIVWSVFESTERRVAAYIPLALSIVSIAAMFVIFSPAREVPGWEFPRSETTLSPVHPNRRYLSLYAIENIMADGPERRRSFGIRPEFLPGNNAMLMQAHLVNGYSPVGPAAMKRLLAMETHGAMIPRYRQWVLEHATGNQGFLAHLGIDGLILPRPVFERYRTLLQSRGWNEAARTEGAVIVEQRERRSFPIAMARYAVKFPQYEDVGNWIFAHKTLDLPLAILAPDGPAHDEAYVLRRIERVSEERLRTTVDVAPAAQQGKSLIVFMRPWLPGWRATLNGRPLSILRADSIMPAVEIDSHEHGHLVLEYRPASLLIGGTLAVAALIAIAAASLWTIRRRRVSP